MLARRAEHAEAERLARDAVALSDETDQLDTQGDAYADLAEVLVLADRPEETAEALEQALARYERKEDLVKAGRRATGSLRCEETATNRTDRLGVSPHDQAHHEHRIEGWVPISPKSGSSCDGGSSERESHCAVARAPRAIC